MIPNPTNRKRSIMRRSRAVLLKSSLPKRFAAAEAEFAPEPFAAPDGGADAATSKTQKGKGSKR